MVVHYPDVLSVDEAVSETAYIYGFQGPRVCGLGFCPRYWVSKKGNLVRVDMQFTRFGELHTGTEWFRLKQ